VSTPGSDGWGHDGYLGGPGHDAWNGLMCSSAGTNILCNRIGQKWELQVIWLQVWQAEDKRKCRFSYGEPASISESRARVARAVVRSEQVSGQLKLNGYMPCVNMKMIV